MHIELNMRAIPDKDTEKNNKITRSPSDTRDQLRKQYKFLCRSTQAAINGDLDEIDRIALALRILFHTKGRSKSLLSQLMPEIQMLDTCSNIPLPPDSGEIIKQGYKPIQCFRGGMVCMTFGPNVWTLTPSSTPAWISAEDWWNRILFIDGNIEFSRKKLILCVADTDGGAHIDKELEQCYFALTRLGSVGIQFFIDGAQHFPNGPEKVILPHIGLEVVSSLKRAFPEICLDLGLPEVNQSTPCV